MNRPEANIRDRQQKAYETDPKWSGTGSYVTHQTPVQSVIIEEGSLITNPNIAPIHSKTTTTVFSVPLAPMKPLSSDDFSSSSSTKPNYYATSNASRQNQSRAINTYGSSNQWNPIITRTNKYPVPNQNLMPPVYSTNTYTIPNHNLMPPHKNPYDDQQIAGSQNRNSFNIPMGLLPPAKPLDSPPVDRYDQQIPSEESNLYGALQPPPPPATTPLSYIQSIPQQPHYSPSYSAVAHAHNNPKTVNQPESMPDRKGYMPPNYNQQYYNNAKANANSEHHDDEMSKLPVSDALRMLLRPYFNRSGTVSEDEASRAESHIMNLASTTPKSNSYSNGYDHDAELITTSEQSNLATVPTQVNNRSPHSHSSNGMHNRDYHLKHPNLPEPSSDKYYDATTGHHMGTPHLHNHHHHHTGQHGFQHNPEFHAHHPHLPNPFKEDSNRRGYAQVTTTTTTTPKPVVEVRGIDLRNTLSARTQNEECQFNCGNGKCAKYSEVTYYSIFKYKKS